MSERQVLKIRERERRGCTREAGWRHTEWIEWQVVDGRTIIGRFDTEDEARKFASARERKGE